MTERREEFVDTDFEMPVGQREISVATIAADVLGVDRLGRSDSFYDFGCTSLQALRICARVERDVGLRALPVWLFETDVLADFVGRLHAEGQPVNG